MAGDVKHDYHLVKPSPWPLLASLSMLLLVLGTAGYMKGLWFVEKGALWALLPGFVGLVFVLIGWWGDVIKESRGGDHTEVVQISLRYGMVLFIASEVMFFVAWFWAFFNSALFPADAVQATRDAIFGCGPGTAAGACSVPGTWPPKGIETFDPWHLPLLNTLLLLTSGTTVTWAHHALLHNDRKGLKYGLILTIILGVVFFVVVTPIGLVMRLFGKDILRMRTPKSSSYWIRRDRPLDPQSLRNQF